MTPEEIKAKFSKLAALYTAKANGKTLQYLTIITEVWVDCDESAAPTMESDLSRWRVKPEPRRMWTFESRTGETVTTTDESLVADWKITGYTVTEWKEVLP